MTVQTQEILHSFDLLPDGDKRELVGEILRRSLTWDAPALSDEQLACVADEVFQQMDRGETGDAS
jgi:hypothetical protein